MFKKFIYLFVFSFRLWLLVILQIPMLSFVKNLLPQSPRKTLLALQDWTRIELKHRYVNLTYVLLDINHVLTLKKKRLIIDDRPRSSVNLRIQFGRCLSPLPRTMYAEQAWGEYWIKVLEYKYKYLKK